MTNIILFVINIFFIPTISLTITYYFNKDHKKSWFEYLLLYISYVVITLLFAGILRFLIRWLFNKTFDLSSLKYTAIGTMVSLIIVLPFNLFKYKVEIKSKLDLNQTKNTQNTNEENINDDNKKS